MLPTRQEQQAPVSEPEQQVPGSEPKQQVPGSEPKQQVPGLRPESRVMHLPGLNRTQIGIYNSKGLPFDPDIPVFHKIS